MDKATDKATDKDLPAMVAPVVMVADSLNNYPLGPLPAPILSAFYPYPPLSMIVGPNLNIVDHQLDSLNRRLWQWFTTVDADRSGHISVVELR